MIVRDACPAPLFSLQPAAHHPPPVRRAGRLAAHAGEAAAAALARWGHCRWRGVDDRVGAAGGGKARLLFLYAPCLAARYKGWWKLSNCCRPAASWPYPPRPISRPR